MTRQVTIVNSSNWDNEPCLVNGVLLQTGEQMTIGINDAETIKVEPVKTLAAPKPFGDVANRTDSHIPQVLPEIRVAWVKGGGMLRKNDEVVHREVSE